MSMAGTDYDVLIAGGGIGGLAAAVALGSAGRRVNLVEQAARFAEIGAGLQLGPNAIRSLDRLGVWGELEPLAVKPRATLVMDAVSGRQLTRVEFGSSFVQRYGYPYVVAHRHDLHRILLAAAERLPTVTLALDSRIEEVTESSDAAHVRFADGTERTASIVVGADGIRSRTRLLHDNSEPLFSGQVAFRGTVSSTDLAPDFDPADMVLWLGPNRHLIQYPVRGGNLYNLVAVIDSVWHREGRDEWGTRAELDEVFADSCPAVHASLALFDNHKPWPIYDRDPISTWHTDHTVLIGDAAHAMRQYLAQGACQALEDVLVLSRELAERPDDQAGALAAYQSRRLDLATRCQQVARPWGDLWHTSDETMRALRDRYFRLRADDDYTEFDWLYLDNVGHGLPRLRTASS